MFNRKVKIRYCEAELLRKLKQMRRDRSVRQISKLTGISERSIYNWLCGHSSMNPTHRTKLQFTIDRMNHN